MALSLEYDSAMFPAVRSASFGISGRAQLGAGLTLIAALLCKVWIRIETTDAGYELARARQEMIELDREERALSFELSSAMHPDALRKAASQLGFKPTEQSQIWKIEGGMR